MFSFCLLCFHLDSFSIYVGEFWPAHHTVAAGDGLERHSGGAEREQGARITQRKLLPFGVHVRIRRRRNLQKEKVWLCRMLVGISTKTAVVT